MSANNKTQEKIQSQLSNRRQNVLHTELLQLRKKEQELTHVILEKLQRMEQDRQYLQLGYSSLFDYLVRGLGYSESSAYRRQSCLRLTKELPELKKKIQSGTLTPAGLSMAFKTLKGKSTKEKRQLLSKIENQPSRRIKRILIQETTAPDIQVRKTEYRDKVILRLELSHTMNQKLERLKALKSHSGEIEDLLERLIDKELNTFEVKAYEAQPEALGHMNIRSTGFTVTRPTTQASRNPRYINRRLRNELLHQAQYKCQQPGCEETHYLQIDHIRPVRKGGPSNKENLQVLCGAHNRMKG